MAHLEQCEQESDTTAQPQAEGYATPKRRPGEALFTSCTLTVGERDPVIVLAERRRLVHDARAARRRHVAVADHPEGARGLQVLVVGQDRLVGAAFQLPPLQPTDDLQGSMLM